MFFKYLAVSKNGKKYKSSVQADSADEAVSILEAQGLEVVYVKRKFVLFYSKLTDFDLFLMFDFLAKFLSNGVTLDKSLDMIASCSLKCSNVCLSMKNFITKGFSFSDALKRNKSVFNNSYLSLFSVIDEVGSIQDFCGFLAKYYKRIDEQKKQIKQNMKYPMILLFFFSIMFIVIIKFLIPNIVMIITQTNQEIPFLLSMLNYISLNLIFILILIFVSFLIFFFFKKRLAKFWEIIPIIRKYRFYRDFSFFFYINYILLSNQIKVINAFKIAKNSMISEKNIDFISQICKNVESGFSIKEAFEKAGIESSLCKMVGLYEKSSNLKSGFFVISDIYESEMFDVLRRIRDYVQPISLSLVAFLIGVVAYSVIIPIYNSFI